VRGLFCPNLLLITYSLFLILCYLLLVTCYLLLVTSLERLPILPPFIEICRRNYVRNQNNGPRNRPEQKAGRLIGTFNNRGNNLEHRSPRLARRKNDSQDPVIHAEVYLRANLNEPLAPRRERMLPQALERRASRSRRVRRSVNGDGISIRVFSSLPASLSTFKLLYPCGKLLRKT